MAGRWTFVLVIALACAMVTGEKAADGKQVETMQPMSYKSRQEAEQAAREAYSNRHQEADQAAREASWAIWEAKSRSVNATEAARAAIEAELIVDAAELRAVEARRVKEAAHDVLEFRGYQLSKQEFVTHLNGYHDPSRRYDPSRQMDDLFAVFDTNRDNHLSPLLVFADGMRQSSRKSMEFSIYFWEMVRWLEGDGKGAKEGADGANDGVDIDDDDDPDDIMWEMADDVKTLEDKPGSRASWLTYFREHGYKIPERYMNQVFNQFDQNLDNELSPLIVFGACLLTNQDWKNRQQAYNWGNYYWEIVRWTEGAMVAARAPDSHELGGSSLRGLGLQATDMLTAKKANYCTQKLFQQLDNNKDNMLSQDEISAYLAISLEEFLCIESLMKDKDKNNNGLISWGEFFSDK